jgi:hypothetical protein
LLVVVGLAFLGHFEFLGRLGSLAELELMLLAHLADVIAEGLV